MKKFFLGMVTGVFLAVSILAGAQSLINPGMIVQQESPKFPDVSATAFYADAANYMQKLGVINGYENGNFGPNDTVTRAQMATILKRYDDTLMLLVDDYCSQHQLKMGMMATKKYTDLCINRGKQAYALQ